SVDRDRAPRRQRHALRADALVLRGERRFLEEYEGAVLAPQLLALFRIGLHPVTDAVHRHVFFRDDAAVDQISADRRIRLAVAGDVIETQQLAVVELDARGTLDLREERVDRILDVADFQAAAGDRAVFDLGAIEITEHFAATRELRRRTIKRHLVFVAWVTRAVEFRLVVAGEKSLRLA